MDGDANSVHRIAATVSSAAVNPVSLARRVCSMRKIPLFRYGLESAVVLHRGGKRRRVRVRQRAVLNVQRPDARVREAKQVSVRIALCAKDERRVVVIAGAFDALDKLAVLPNRVQTAGFDDHEVHQRRALRQIHRDADAIADIGRERISIILPEHEAAVMPDFLAEAGHVDAVVDALTHVDDGVERPVLRRDVVELHARVERTVTAVAECAGHGVRGGFRNQFRRQQRVSEVICRNVRFCHHARVDRQVIHLRLANAEDIAVRIALGTDEQRAVIAFGGRFGFGDEQTIRIDAVACAVRYAFRGQIRPAQSRRRSDRKRC